MSTGDLNATQLAWAKAIVGAVKTVPDLSSDEAERVTDIALAVAKVESDLLMYANKYNGESLRLPHDAVGSNYGSVGLFQQQVGGAAHSTANWGTTAQCMSVTYSTHKFISELLKFDWKNMSNGEAAQKVQGSAYPDRYAAQDVWAIALRKELWPLVGVKYTVRTGDTLSGIATKFHIAGGYQTLAKWNHLSDPNKISPGQVLQVSSL